MELACHFPWHVEPYYCTCSVVTLASNSCADWLALAIDSVMGLLPLSI
jgi:hypothetical protein